MERAGQGQSKLLSGKHLGVGSFSPCAYFQAPANPTEILARKRSYLRLANHALAPRGRLQSGVRFPHSLRSSGPCSLSRLFHSILIKPTPALSNSRRTTRFLPHRALETRPDPSAPRKGSRRGSSSSGNPNSSLRNHRNADDWRFRLPCSSPYHVTNTHSSVLVKIGPC